MIGRDTGSVGGTWAVASGCSNLLLELERLRRAVEVIKRRAPPACERSMAIEITWPRTRQYAALMEQPESAHRGRCIMH